MSTVLSNAARFGYTDAAWQAAKVEMQRVIAQTAASRQLISYGALCSKVRTIRFEPDSTALAYMLGEICRDEDALGRGLLTVIVVHKHGDKRPGPGFFEVAHELGRDTTDEDACWVAELNRVYGDWKGKHIP
jgi:hypothetical protein